MSLVQAIGVARAYRGILNGFALAPTSLEIEHGEFVAIVGPSGSGKSTLMNLIGLLDRPSAGTLLFEGRSCANLSPDHLARMRNRRLGFVFQQYHLLPRLTALANVELPLAYASVPRKERRRRAEAALRAVGLPWAAERRPASLSGGEQQRVAIARAIVATPALLLADEPTGALDSASGQAVLELLESLNAAGMAVVLVTHDMKVAARAQRVIRMRDGEIVADDRRESAANDHFLFEGERATCA